MKKQFQTIAKEIAAFFSSPIILKNLGLFALAVVAFLFITSSLLRACTRHGESLQVEELVGLDLRDAQQQAKRSNLNIVILDSLDRGDRPPNMVISQDPAPFSRVKKNRTIYLTTTRFTREKTVTPPISERDNIKDYKRSLTVKGINTAIKEEKTNRRYLEGTILEVYHEGKKISFDQIDDGYELEKGSTLEFVITKYGVEYVNLPDVNCDQFSTAEIRLKNSRLVVGMVREDVTVVDRSTAYVYKTIPSYTDDLKLQVGQQVDLYLTQDLPVDCGGNSVEEDL